jgi:hypothetical protein
MIKCPRCNLEQKESSQCEYCGLVVEEFKEPARASKPVRSKKTLLAAVVLVAIGALLFTYFLNFYPKQPGEKPTSVERSNAFAPKTGEDGLRTAAKKLSGDLGIVENYTRGHTKGSIIAMVIFSVVGLGYFTYGKKSKQFLMLICGVALMGYSYFVDGILYIILIGVGLSAIPFILGRK